MNELCGLERERALCGRILLEKLVSPLICRSNLWLLWKLNVYYYLLTNQAKISVLT